MSSEAASPTKLQPLKPLFTLQHSSVSKSSKGNDLASLCFLPKLYEYEYEDKTTNATCNNDNDNDNDDHDHDDSSSSGDSDSESSSDLQMPQFKSHSILFSKPKSHNNPSSYASKYQYHSSALDSATRLSFSQTLLALSHANGSAYIWDLTKRRVVATLSDHDPNGPGSGPGLAIERMMNSNGHQIFHQRRDEN